MLQHALDLLKKGKPVFPCGKNKKPLIDWLPFQKRLPTVGEVTNWWTQNPEANIAMPTGTLSGVAVVDIDPRHGGVVPLGMPNLTTVIKTGNGGWHYYFAYVDGVRNADSRGTGFPGVDIRGEGGYVIVPPSVTDYIDEKGEKTGGKYEVVVNEELLPFPVDFFPCTRGDRKKFDAAKVVMGVGVGSRNMSAASLAGSMMAKYPRNEWETVVWQLLKSWNNTNSKPLAESELRGTFESIAKTHVRNHGQLVNTDNYEMKPLSQIATNEADDPRFSIGLPSLDNILIDEDLITTGAQGGVALGEFMIIGGRPKHGKTLIAVQVAKALIDQGFRCLWLSYEGKMKKLKKIMTRAKVKTDELITIELKNKVPLIGRVDWIEEQIKKGLEQFGTQAVFIDNLSFLQPREGDRSSSQFEQLGKIVGDIHQLAVQYDIVICLLAHVRKPPNQTGAPKRARMYDLSGTSTLEQLCDIGIMVERQYVNENEYSNKSFIHLDANRPSGEVRSVEVMYQDGVLVPADMVRYAQQMLGGVIID